MLKEIMETKLIEYSGYVLQVSNLVDVLMIIVGAWVLLTLIRIPLNRRVKKKTLEKSSAYATMQIVRYVVWTIALLMSLQAAGFNVSLLLAGSAALLVGVGLGLQQTFADFISGVILLLDSSIKIDDVLEFDGMICKVAKIGVRTSTVINRDDVHVIVPNSKFTSEKIINWTHTERFARFSITVGVHYNSNVETVRDCLLKCAKEHPKLLKDPAPIVRFDDFSDSSLTFNLFFYTREVFRVEIIRSDLRMAILQSFRDHKIEIPFPQRDLNLRNFPDALKRSETTAK